MFFLREFSENKKSTRNESGNSFCEPHGPEKNLEKAAASLNVGKVTCLLFTSKTLAREM